MSRVSQTLLKLRALVRPRRVRSKTTATTNSVKSSAPTTANSGAKWVAGGWSLFLVENIVLSENREWLHEQYGADNYHLCYNTLSTSACLSILYGFLKFKGTGSVWTSSFVKGAAPLHIRGASIALQSFGLLCFSQLVPALQIPVALETGGENPAQVVQSQQLSETAVDDKNLVGPSRRPSPTSSSSGLTSGLTFKARCPMDFRSKPDLPPDAVYGVERITRHHNLWALASMGVGTALVTPFLVESLFFGGPLLLATFGTAHQDTRFRRGMGGTLTPEKESVTSNIPFAALLLGRQDWTKLLDEMKWLNGGVATLLVFALHNIK